MTHSKMVQAKNIADTDILTIIRRHRASGDYTSLWHLVAELDPQFPWKVVRAKIASMMRRRLIEGCSCGCGSPMWELDADGREIHR